MDNLTQCVLLVERIEQVPRNDIELYRMDWFKIRSLMQNPGPDTVLHKNEQMLKIISRVGSFSWLTMFYRNQKILPADSINYWLITHKEKNINYNIVLFEIDISKLPDKFYSYFTSSPQDEFSFEYLINIMKHHFEEMNNLNNRSCENESISNIITKTTKEYYKSKAIEQPEFIKTPLYLYQRVNVYWMASREDNPLAIALSDDKIINWGPQLEINTDKKLVLKKSESVVDQVSNSPIKTNYLVGGCLCDDVGLGKTLQIYTLALAKPSTTLIIVPSHLVSHWVSEYHKHVETNANSELIVCNGAISPHDIAQYNESAEKLIVLGTFEHLKSGAFIKFKFTRIVIDEFHEIADVKGSMIDKLNADFKWVVTATPFVNSNMISNILNWVGKVPVQYANITKYKKYINTFSEMFRKNTKANVTSELGLPQIKEIKYYLTFSQKEKLFYDSICNSKDIVQMKRNFCINPSLYFKKDDVDAFVSIDALDDTLKAHHKKEYDNQAKKVYEFKLNWLKSHQTVKTMLETNEKKAIEQEEKAKKKLIATHNLTDSTTTMHKEINLSGEPKELTEEEKIQKEKETNEKFWDQAVGLDLVEPQSIEKFKYLNKILQGIKASMTYFNSQLDLINKSKALAQSEKSCNCVPDNNEETECGICLGELDAQFTILHCGHMFCYECIKLLSKSPLTKCPMCKIGLTNTVNYVVGVDNTPNDYGTKISQLIKICKEKKEKIILFSHTKALLENLSRILGEYKIKAKLFNQKDLMTFETDDVQVLILSSESNASGLNFQFVSTVILLEPLEGEYIYRKQIENQIIGRLHRIGQTRPIEFIRLIMMGSIESQIDSANKIADAIYSETNDEFNLPMNQVEIHA